MGGVDKVPWRITMPKLIFEVWADEGNVFSGPVCLINDIIRETSWYKAELICTIEASSDEEFLAIYCDLIGKQHQPLFRSSRQFTRDEAAQQRAYMKERGME